MNNYNMSNPTIGNIKRAIASAETSIFIAEATRTPLAKINYVALKTLVNVARAKFREGFISEDSKNDKV